MASRLPVAMHDFDAFVSPDECAVNGFDNLLMSLLPRLPRMGNIHHQKRSGWMAGEQFPAFLTARPGLPTRVSTHWTLRTSRISGQHATTLIRFHQSARGYVPERERFQVRDRDIVESRSAVSKFLIT